tara:strand:+ start:132 stop:308 length:177 start_codon:yes stop_codon:yes gene_type:complete
MKQSKQQLTFLHLDKDIDVKIVVIRVARTVPPTDTIAIIEDASIYYIIIDIFFIKRNI